jgi:hypothetical protein
MNSIDNRPSVQQTNPRTWSHAIAAEIERVTAAAAIRTVHSGNKRHHHPSATSNKRRTAASPSPSASATASKSQLNSDQRNDQQSATAGNDATKPNPTNRHSGSDNASEPQRIDSDKPSIASHRRNDANSSSESNSTSDDPTPRLQSHCSVRSQQHL